MFHFDIKKEIAVESLILTTNGMPKFVILMFLKNNSGTIQGEGNDIL